MRTLGLLKDGVASLAFVSKTNFGCVLFEATYVVNMEALGFHKHANIRRFLVLLRDLAATVPAHGCALCVVYKWGFLFFVIFLGNLLMSDFRDDFGFLNEYLRLLLLLSRLLLRENS